MTFCNSKYAKGHMQLCGSALPSLLQSMGIPVPLMSVGLIPNVPPKHVANGFTRLKQDRSASFTALTPAEVQIKGKFFPPLQSSCVATEAYL